LSGVFETVFLESVTLAEMDISCHHEEGIVSYESDLKSPRVFQVSRSLSSGSFYRQGSADG
jgi:hypothetical protein